MHIHILGICGTFMAGVAAIAKAAGHRVTGSDRAVYPPMSDQLVAMGIDLIEGYEADQLSLSPDVVLVGNVMTRSMPVVEMMLNRRLPYMSGPEWLAKEVLRKQRVVGVAGTHGKTTTTSLLAWILEKAGREPGFLIGGVPQDFGVSARLGAGKVFVIEADEYDTAFFDKRAKFLHYRPEIQIINNLEFDHADIYANLEAIQWQFHQLIRALPGNGRLIVPAGDENIRAVIEQGCWTPIDTFSSQRDSGADWVGMAEKAGELRVSCNGTLQVRGAWQMTGAYNAENAVAAMLAARQLGVTVEASMQAIKDFKGVKRRLELLGTFGGVSLYDDFAHHPTEIRRTIAGVRSDMQSGRLLVILELRSNTMKAGVHRDTLAAALREADHVWIFRPADLAWDLGRAMKPLKSATVCNDVNTIVDQVTALARAGDKLVVMSNGGFDNIHGLLERALSRRSAS
jgi:UDP-N-acetylmuramate: L-alanyl-gamma-D-glutamyl-meso-diaminopimelate ligase